MAKIEQSIEVHVPARQLFSQLTRFEDYARFMANVDQVRRLDDSHLRWTTTMANRPVVWDSLVETNAAEHRIAWRATNGVENAGSLEVQAVDESAARVVFTLQAEAGQFPGAVAGDSDAETSQRLTQSLQDLKTMAEGQSAGDGPACGILQPGNIVSAASASGSPTEMLEDEPDELGPGGTRRPRR